jgi:hypothetical protein
VSGRIARHDDEVGDVVAVRHGRAPQPGEEGAGAVGVVESVSGEADPRRAEQLDGGGDVLAVRQLGVGVQQVGDVVAGDGPAVAGRRRAHLRSA